jgi:hypothetical protein
VTTIYKKAVINEEGWKEGNAEKEDIYNILNSSKSKIKKKKTFKNITHNQKKAFFVLHQRNNTNTNDGNYYSININIMNNIKTALIIIKMTTRKD